MAQMFAKDYAFNRIVMFLIDVYYINFYCVSLSYIGDYMSIVVCWSLFWLDVCWYIVTLESKERTQLLHGYRFKPKPLASKVKSSQISITHTHQTMRYLV